MKLNCKTLCYINTSFMYLSMWFCKNSSSGSLANIEIQYLSRCSYNMTNDWWNLACVLLVPCWKNSILLSESALRSLKSELKSFAMSAVKSWHAVIPDIRHGHVQCKQTTNCPKCEAEVNSAELFLIDIKKKHF